MSFTSPLLLLLLLPVVALAAAYLVLQRRRRRYAVRFTNLELLDTVAPQRPGWRRHLPAAAAGLALAALVVALAGPTREAQVPREAASLMLALDVSGSMEATDVDPDRITAAIAAASTFVHDLPDGFQVGLVAFDSNARMVSTPTTDHEAVMAALQHLEVGPGTAAGEAIRTSLAGIADAQAASGIGLASTTAPPDEAVASTIVLLSDGVTTTGLNPVTAASMAADAGVPVSTITYGTDAGTVTVDGGVVPVPPDTATMAEIASTTGGTAFEAASGDELASVYQDIQARVGYVTETQDITSWFLAGGLVLLALACLGGLLWTGRFL
jgi:Ca-activated chloride channel family protein